MLVAALEGFRSTAKIKQQPRDLSLDTAMSTDTYPISLAFKHHPSLARTRAIVKIGESFNCAKQNPEQTIVATIRSQEVIGHYYFSIYVPQAHVNDLKHRRREAASLKIASVVRGRQARRRVSQLRQEQIAATYIQELDRRGDDERHVENTEGGEPHAAATRGDEAARTIQKVARGRVDRLYLKTVREQKSAAMAMQKKRPESTEPTGIQEVAGGKDDEEDSTLITEEKAAAFMMQEDPEGQGDRTNALSHLSIDQRPVNLIKHEVGMNASCEGKACCPSYYSSGRLFYLVNMTALAHGIYAATALYVARPFRLPICFMRAIYDRDFARESLIIGPGFVRATCTRNDVRCDGIIPRQDSRHSCCSEDAE